MKSVYGELGATWLVGLALTILLTKLDFLNGMSAWDITLLLVFVIAGVSMYYSAKCAMRYGR